MKYHAISFKDDNAYSRHSGLLFNRYGLDAVEVRPEKDGNGNAYLEALYETDEEISEEAERAIDRIDGVLASQFNEERR